MKRKIQMLVGAVLTVALVWFLFRDTDWAEVWSALRHASVPWMAACIFFVVLAFFTRAQRWSYIVRTAGPVPFGVLFDATQIGFLANFVLPARAGEAIRALVLARLTGFPITKCLAFGFLDRVTDLIALFALLVVTVIVYRPVGPAVLPPGFELPDWASGMLEPSAIRNGAAFVAVAIVALTAVMVVLYLKADLALRISDAVLGRVSQKFAERMHGWIEHFAEGLHVLRSLRALTGSINFSLITWAVSGLAIWAGMQAFAIEGPWYTSLLVLAMTSIAISAPSTPGFVGAFHLGVMLGLFLAIDNLNPDKAKAFAIFSHLANLVPVIVVGVGCLARRQIGLVQLGREAEHIEEEQR